jgi:hypothetical protein
MRVYDKSYKVINKPITEIIIYLLLLLYIKFYILNFKWS